MARASHPRRRNLWIYLGLAIVVLAVYSEVRHFEFLNYDDPDYVDNAHVRAGLSLANAVWAFTSTDAANWFPLTWFSHMLDRDLFGVGSGADHLMNLLLHMLSALLLFAVMKQMTGAVWRSAFVALIFALHPLHIESVAWVAERKDVLSGLFFFATLWAYLNYVERRGIGRYMLLTLAFCCALMSKPTTVTLPFVLLLLDYWPLKRHGWTRLVLEKAPLIALSILASAITFIVQQRGGAVLSATQIPLSMRIGNALVSYITYLAQFFWPVNLAVFYPYPAAIPLRQEIAAGSILAAITAATLAARRGYLTVGWFWFLGTLLPMIGLIQAGVQSRADRYTYLPLTGLAIMLAWGLTEQLEPRAWGKKALAGASIAASIAMAAVTYANLQHWHDSISLFRHAIEVTDGNYIADNNLGVALRKTGRTAEAIPLFEAALSANPMHAEAQNNLGEALLLHSKVDQAIPHIVEALRLNPQLADAHVNLGAALNKSGRFAEAAEQYRIALQLQPENADAHGGLGATLTELDRSAEALPQLLEAIRIRPEYADAHYNLGRLFGLTGRTDEAIAQFSETIRLDPSSAEAHFNLGTAFASKDRMAEAVDQFRSAVRLQPDYMSAHFNLASALASEARYDEAIPEFSEVLRLKPDFREARQGLEYCLALRKQK